MKERIIFNQPAGLGDMLFIMAIAEKYISEGHKILWPTAAHYINITKNFPDIKFIQQESFFLYNFYDQKRDIFEDDNYTCIPFRWADLKYNNGQSNLWTCMEDKYRLVNLESSMWPNFKIKRDYETELKVFKELGLEDGEEYNFINENQTRIFQKTKIEVNNGLKNIYMTSDVKYNLFDWCTVMEKAKTIHTVSTSVVFLVDLLKDTTSDINIYKRIWDKEHQNLFFLRKKWNLC